MEKQIILVQEEPRGPSQMVEIPVATGQQRVPLPDVQQLRNTQGQTIVIKAIRLITAKVLTAAPIGGQTTAPRDELRKMSLVLYAEGWEKGQLIPVLEFNDNHDSDTAAATTISFRGTATRLADWKNVDWPKSYLQFSNGTAAAGGPYAVLLDVEYIKLDANNKEIIGPSL